MVICSTIDMFRQVIFWPGNILGLFRKFNVEKKFDFLSGNIDQKDFQKLMTSVMFPVDTDSYDFFMTEAILKV